MSTGFKVTISIIITAIIIGGGTYYYLNQKAEQEKTDLNNQISDLENEPVTSTITDENPNGPVDNQETVSWKTYKNGLYGFNLQYPSNWTLAEGVQGGSTDKSVVSLASPETTAAFKAANGKEGAYSDDFSIYYYISVADEAENKANNYGAKTIDQLISTNPAIQKIGSTTLGGLPATDVYWSGLGKYYAILAMKQDHLLKVWFSNIDDKANLTDTEKKIISSVQFTD